MSRPKGSQELLEWRRKRAAELLQKGKTPKDVAEFLGFDRNTVYRIRRRMKKFGDDGIKAKPIPGRPPRLTQEEVKKVFDLILQEPATSYGFPSPKWTCDKIGKILIWEFCWVMLSSINLKPTPGVGLGLDNIY